MSFAQKEQETNVSDRIVRVGFTGGTPAEALLSSPRLDAKKHWASAIDEMLRWKSAPTEFNVEDRPTDEVLETAIDYAVDQSEDPNGASPPSSIIPSGARRIAMEWNDGDVTLIVEFIALGRAARTIFIGGKVADKRILARNPSSRKMEIRG